MFGFDSMGIEDPTVGQKMPDSELYFSDSDDYDTDDSLYDEEEDLGRKLKDILQNTDNGQNQDFATTYVNETQKWRDEAAIACLDAHNEKRALHEDTNPLKLCNILTEQAQKAVDYLAQNDIFDHLNMFMDSPYQRSGENLYCSWGGNYNNADAYKKHGARALTNWYEEIKNYDYATQKKIDPAGCAIGHFTQAVWAKTTKVGFGIAVSPKGKMFVLCRYYPAGNITNAGYYAANVKALASAPSAPPAVPEKSEEELKAEKLARRECNREKRQEKKCAKLLAKEAAQREKDAQEADKAAADFKAGAIAPVTGSINLKPESFFDQISTGNWFVKMYSPYCPPCKRMAPDWETLADNLRSEGYSTNIGSLDCSKYSGALAEVISKTGLRYFPTLFFFKDGEKVGDHGMNSRSLESLTDAVKKAFPEDKPTPKADVQPESNPPPAESAVCAPGDSSCNPIHNGFKENPLKDRDMISTTLSDIKDKVGAAHMRDGLVTWEYDETLGYEKLQISRVEYCYSQVLLDVKKTRGQLYYKMKINDPAGFVKGYSPSVTVVSWKRNVNKILARGKIKYDDIEFAPGKWIWVKVWASARTSEELYVDVEGDDTLSIQWCSNNPSGYRDMAYGGLAIVEDGKEPQGEPTDQSDPTCDTTSDPYYACDASGDPTSDPTCNAKKAKSAPNCANGTCAPTGECDPNDPDCMEEAADAKSGCVRFKNVNEKPVIVIRKQQSPDVDASILKIVKALDQYKMSMEVFWKPSYPKGWQTVASLNNEYPGTPGYWWSIYESPNNSHINLTRDKPGKGGHKSSTTNKSLKFDEWNLIEFVQTKTSDNSYKQVWLINGEEVENHPVIGAGRPWQGLVQAQLRCQSYAPATQMKVRNWVYSKL